MSKKATKKTAKKKPVENKPAAPATPKTLDELLAPGNDYERIIASHVRDMHDANLEAAIVEHQRSIGDCLNYVVSCAAGKRAGKNCVMMSDDEVYGLAVHWFLDGDTPTEVAGAGFQASEMKPNAKPAKKEKAKKPKKEKKGAADIGLQLTFDFGEEQL